MTKKRQSTSPASSGYRPRKKIIAEDPPIETPQANDVIIDNYDTLDTPISKEYDPENDPILAKKK